MEVTNKGGPSIAYSSFVILIVIITAVASKFDVAAMILSFFIAIIVGHVIRVIFREPLI